MPYVDDLGTGRKPAFRSAVCPLADRMALIHACAAVLLVERETTAISYRTRGCAQAGIRTTVDLVAHRPARP